MVDRICKDVNYILTYYYLSAYCGKNTMTGLKLYKLNYSPIHIVSIFGTPSSGRKLLWYILKGFNGEGYDDGIIG